MGWVGESSVPVTGLGWKYHRICGKEMDMEVWTCGEHRAGFR